MREVSYTIDYNLIWTREKNFEAKPAENYVSVFKVLFKNAVLNRICMNYSSELLDDE